MQYKNKTDIKFIGAEKAKSDKLRACGECCKLIRPKDEVTIVMYTYRHKKALDPILEKGTSWSFEFLCPECGEKHFDLP